MSVRMQGSGSSFENLSDQLGTIMDELMGRSFSRLASASGWEPQLNVYELADCYMVCVDLAGMSHEDIEVHADAGTLHVAGNRPRPQLPERTETPSVQVMEIDWGRFHRKVSIPNDVDISAVTASYRKGYLWVLLPKRASQSRG